ncbi:NAD(+) diphosphatase [Actinophytocola gossypii]|uniref:NAD(+) diphosphatase n=1 Tax=Actinophytocola gossypii TaxID=2812003 RepID=A0ABT2J680_9PSEU|nr:NAD(+) diphosphatase [Actinophytocola gossypii]MCT2583364.1 NAD(+) diphosphatase [Actinophytocola gossypii]
MTPLPYNEVTLDRAGARRADEAWVASARTRSRVLAFWRDGCLTADGRPVSFDGDPAVFLGLDGDTAVFAADLSDLAEPDALALAGADAVRDVRQLFGAVGPAEAAVLAYARGMLHWHRNQRFCGACGDATEPRHGGHQLVCRGCEKPLFPRIEPAVIMLVTSADGSRCLLGRHRGAAQDAYSTLAGFVEVGESLEDAVRRELAEEAGVTVTSVRYQASQAWPFPSGLMVGFRAVAASSAVAVDEDELIEACWFTRSAVRDLIGRHRAAGRERRDSIESYLVSTWLDEE